MFTNGRRDTKSRIPTLIHAYQVIMSTGDKAKVVIKFGQLNKIEELRVIVDNLEEQEVSMEICRLTVIIKTTLFLQLQDICESAILNNDINTFFHYLLKGFTDSDESKEQRFNIVSFVLNLLNREELNTKSTLDLITRICVDLDSFTHDQTVRLVESCIESIRQPQSRTVYWKDFLPQLITIVYGIPSLLADGIRMTGVEYRSAIIKNLTLLQWRLDILTPLAAMFKWV